MQMREEHDGSRPPNDGLPCSLRAVRVAGRFGFFVRLASRADGPSANLPLTLRVHLSSLGIRRVWVCRVHLAVALLVHLLGTGRIGASSDLSGAVGLITDRRKVRTRARRIGTAGGRLSGRVGGVVFDRSGSTHGTALTFFFLLARSLFLLLALLPLFANLLELYDYVSKCATRMLM